MPAVRNAPVYPAEAWKRAGPLLRARRHELMHGNANLTDFIRHTPGAPDYAALRRFESGRPGTPLAPIILKIEQAYRLKRGTLHCFLTGQAGELEVLTPESNPAADAWREEALSQRQRAENAEQELKRLRRGLRKVGGG